MRGIRFIIIFQRANLIIIIISHSCARTVFHLLLLRLLFSLNSGLRPNQCVSSESLMKVEKGNEQMRKGKGSVFFFYYLVVVARAPQWRSLLSSSLSVMDRPAANWKKKKTFQILLIVFARGSSERESIYTTLSLSLSLSDG